MKFDVSWLKIESAANDRLVELTPGRRLRCRCIMLGTRLMDIVCRACLSSSTEKWDSLPTAFKFAGKRLTPPMFGGSLYRCLECGLLFRHPVLSVDAYRTLYDNNKVATWKNDLRRDQEIVLEYVKTNVANGALLDFGCYTGSFLGMLPDQFERFGVEVNERAAGVAEELHRAKIWSSLQEIPESRRFAVVVAMDVIEHMLSPSQLIGELLSFVEPNGLLLLTTGDADSDLWKRSKGKWWYCRYPEHISFISRDWLIWQAKTLPFEIEGFEKFNYVLGESKILRLIRSMLFQVGQRIYPYAAHFIGVIGRKFPKAAHALQGLLLSGRGLSEDHIFIAIRKKRVL